MRSNSTLGRSAIAAAFVLAAGIGFGCGETSDADPTPVQTFKITPAGNATPAVTSAPARTPTAQATAATTGPSGTTLSIVGINIAFDTEELEAAAGSITVEFDNRDGGVLHNMHFFWGDDADDETLAETELEAGPIVQTLTFDAEPGAYFYQCDVHPTTMTGTLTVK
jgi:plastocyanin